MPATCCVVNCGSREDRENVKFFHIPAELKFHHKKDINELSKRRRESWILAIRRTDLTETKLKNSKVCSKHFLTGRPAELKNENDVDWIPSIDMGYGNNYQMASQVAITTTKKRKMLTGEYEGVKDNLSDLRRTFWSDGEVKLFLEIYGKCKNTVQVIDDTIIWEIVSSELAKKNVTKSSNCCREKWKNLLKSYQAALNSKIDKKFGFIKEISFVLNGNECQKESRMNKTSTDCAFWTINETSRLIHIYKNYKSKFKDNPKKTVWRLVAKNLLAEGIDKDPEKCEKKWKSLVSRYWKNKIDTPNNNNNMFPFFGIMKIILEDDNGGDNIYNGDASNEDSVDDADEEVTEEEIDQEVENEEEEQDESFSDEMDCADDENGTADVYEEILIETEVNSNSWTKGEITTLISLYAEHAIRGTISIDVLWQRISADMEINKIKKKPEECSKLWESLCLDYIRCQRNGAIHEFVYFNHIDRIFTNNRKRTSENGFTHKEYCSCNKEKAMDKERRHHERMESVKRKMDIEDRKVTAFEKYLNFLAEEAK